MATCPGTTEDQVQNWLGANFCAGFVDEAPEESAATTTAEEPAETTTAAPEETTAPAETTEAPATTTEVPAEETTSQVAVSHQRPEVIYFTKFQ